MQKMLLNKTDKIFKMCMLFGVVFMFIMILMGANVHAQTIEYNNENKILNYLDTSNCNIEQIYIYEINYKKCVMYGYDIHDIKREHEYVFYNIDDLHVGDCLNVFIDGNNKILKWNVYCYDIINNPYYVYVY